MALRKWDGRDRRTVIKRYRHAYPHAAATTPPFAEFKLLAQGIEPQGRETP